MSDVYDDGQKSNEETRVASYQNNVWESAWKGRARGLWTGLAMGVCMGAVIGALSALSTVLVGVSLPVALGLVMPVVTIFGLIGTGMGILTTTEVGLVSGAIAGGLKEQDKRAVTRPDGAKPPVSSPQVATPLLNEKVLLVGAFAGLVIGGLFIATGGSIAAIGGIHAILALGASAHAASSCIAMAGFAFFGATFGIDLPGISRNINNFMGHILSGNTFEPVVQLSTKAEKAIVPLANEDSTLPPKIQAILNRTSTETHRQRIQQRSGWSGGLVS